MAKDRTDIRYQANPRYRGAHWGGAGPEVAKRFDVPQCSEPLHRLSGFVR